METAAQTLAAAATKPTQLRRWLLAFCLHCLAAQALAGEPLHIDFTNKNQQRISDHWLEHNPQGAFIASQSMGANLGKTGRRLLSAVLGAPPEPTRESSLPQDAVGKLFFTRPDGETGSCSAAFVGSEYTILTAAHCVMDTNGAWFSNIVFVPSYARGVEDHFTMACASVPAEWGALNGPSAMDFDYAFLKASRPSTRGKLELSAETPPSILTLTGYSSNYHRGRRLYTEYVEVGAASPGKLQYGNNRYGVGASGTPWINERTVYSVTSHFYNENQRNMLGPRFTKDTLALASHAAAGCRPSSAAEPSNS